MLPSATAALGAPGGLTVTNKNSNTPVLSWAKVKKATGYQVQVDNDPAFATPEFSASTVNYRAVPTTALRPGQNYWRVRATQGSTNSSWTGATLAVSPVGVPVPVYPGDNAELFQPQSPPLLRWQGAQGAISYTVEVDGDADFIGAKVYTTKNTSLVVTDPLVADDYYWRVTAAKAAGIVSVPSVASRFVIKPLAAPTLTYPPNDVNLPVEDVVMDWAPVPGAKSYDLQVATDSGFNTITESRSNIQSTRYSPITTYNNNQYWWRVRAVDLAGQSTRVDRVAAGLQAAVAGQAQRRVPPGHHRRPAGLRPTPRTSSGPRCSTRPYECSSANDVNFSSKCAPGTASTTYTPGALR